MVASFGRDDGRGATIKGNEVKTSECYKRVLNATYEFACQSIRHITGINNWTGIIRQTERGIPFYNQSINLFAWKFKP